MKRFLLVFSVLINALCLTAQPNTTVNNFINPESGWFATYSCAQAPCGDMFLLANNTITKTNSMAERMWSKNYYGPTITKMEPCSGSAFMFVASSFIGKIDTSGHVLWARKYYRSNITKWSCIKKISDGNFMVLGGDSSMTLLMKMDTSGSVIWSRHYKNEYVPSHTMAAFKNITSGSLVEMPDHSFALLSSTLSPVNNISVQIKGMTLIRVNADGKFRWAKKYIFYRANPWSYEEKWVSAGGDILYTSDGHFIMAMTADLTSRYFYINEQSFVLQADSSGDLNGNVVFADDYPFRIISESPVGHTNILNVGGAATDVLTQVFPAQLIQGNTALTNTTVTRYTALHAPPPTFGYIFPAALQQPDKRFVLWGAGDLNLNSAGENRTVIITDSIGQQNCTSRPGTIVKRKDTMFVAQPITLDMDSGIFVQSFTGYTDSFRQVYQCHCDHSLSARFGFTHTGRTYQFIDSSINPTGRYNWYFGDGTPIDTNKNPTHTFTGALNRTIVHWVEDTCGFGSYSYQLTGQDTLDPPPLNIRTYAAGTGAQLQVYPNPSGGIVHFLWSDSGVVSVAIELTDIRGVVLERLNLNDGIHTGVLDIGHLPAGIYYYRCTDHGRLVQSGKLLLLK